MCNCAFLLMSMLLLVPGRRGLRIRLIVERSIWLLDVGLMDEVWLGLVGVEVRCSLALIGDPLVLLIL